MCFFPPKSHWNLGTTAHATAARIELSATSARAGQDAEFREQRVVVMPPPNETFSYDDDGNMNRNGLWDAKYDGENRLVEQTARADVWLGGVIPPEQKARRIVHVYDYRGRRILKRVFGAGGALIRETSFLYDGWNMVFEADETFGTGAGKVTRSYAWGPDLSETLEGAGGVGGLLSVTVQAWDFAGANGARIVKKLVPLYDGNGNITAYADAATGEILQQEEYGPFGEPLRARPTSLIRCPFGWSTKYTDEETGLVYYGYRFYDPRLGRWINRDPIWEFGGVNLYAVVHNNTIEDIDILGENIYSETLTSVSATFSGNQFSNDRGGNKRGIGTDFSASWNTGYIKGCSGTGYVTLEWTETMGFVPGSQLAKQAMKTYENLIINKPYDVTQSTKWKTHNMVKKWTGRNFVKNKGLNPIYDAFTISDSFNAVDLRPDVKSDPDGWQTNQWTIKLKTPKESIERAKLEGKSIIESVSINASAKVDIRTRGTKGLYGSGRITFQYSDGKSFVRDIQPFPLGKQEVQLPPHPDL